MASSARIDELRKKFDENPRRYFAPLANEYRKAGDLEQAIFICQEYLPQQPGHMSGHIVYGQALYELARHDEARQVFETALSLDPENLIALRHLGDIARQMGDNKAARIWYQRVLEADPRNEEIAQIMMTLLATPDASQMVVSPNTATPLSTPAVPAQPLSIDAARPTDPVGFRAIETGFQVEKSSDGSDLAVGPALTELPERQAPPPIPEWKKPIPDHELLDISDFSVGGVRLADIGTSPSIDEPAQQSIEAPSDASAAEEEFTESSSAFVADASPYERSDDVAAAIPQAFAGAVIDDIVEKDEPPFEVEVPFEADPFAIAATPLHEEHAADIALGLPDDGTTPGLLDATHNDNVIGLETFESGLSAPAADEPTTLEFESFFRPEANVTSVDGGALVDELLVGDVGGATDTPATPAEATADEAWPVLEGAPTADAWSTADDSIADDDTAELEIIEPMSFNDTAIEPATAYEPPAPVWSEPERVFETPIAPIAAVPEPETEAELEPELEPEPVFETPIAPIAAVPEPEPVLAAEEPEPEPEPELVPEPEPEAVRAEAAPEPEAEAEAEAEPEAFVTETMAELYLQQGHLEPALEIYQKLVEQRPHDHQLRDRMRVIEDSLHGRSSREETVETYDEPIAPVSTGPTIRDFLASLVASPVAVTHEVPTPAVPTPAVPTPAVATPLSIETVDDFDRTVDMSASAADTWAESPVESASTENFDLPPIVEAPDSIDEDFGPDETLAPPLATFNDYDTPLSAPRLTPRSTPLVNATITPLSSPTITPLSTPAVTPLSNAAMTPISNAAVTPVSTRSVTPLSTASVPPAMDSRETPIVSPAIEHAPRGTPAEGRRTLSRGMTPPLARETVSGSIDALFSGAGASTNDATAASTLAQAFAPEGPDTKPLQGMPAHKASSELSLDHVFKTGQAPRAEGEGDGFSFDQFFADDLGDNSPKNPHETPASPKQGPDDIAQFNTWLNGLKKT